MSLALHGHHVLIFATLAFVAAVLTPNWFTSSDGNVSINVFQICTNYPGTHSNCQWTYSTQSNDWPSGITKRVYPVLTASFALVCGGLSLIGLLLGAWYIQQCAHEKGSTWSIVVLAFATLFSFLFSSGVWATMLTTNLQQNGFGTSDVSLKYLGFSFWINIGSSVLYLYAFLIYLIIICKG